MVFSSLLFLFRFLPLMLITYFAAPVRFRNGILLIGSLIFYGWGEPIYITLLLFSTVVDFVHGKLIGRMQEQGKQKQAKWVVISSAAINLSLLAFFKYSGLAALPIGISFYTFQTMSYTIDVYRGKAKVQNNIVAFGAYVSMFPQLIAGPIVRYHTIAEELKNRKETVYEFALGIRYFTIGLGKKVLLANNIGALWNEIGQVVPEERTILMAWMGILAFGMQIYFDFSGYSDMATGLGHMFGFHFPENFYYPYTAKSITDFWRRWHISLGVWFKEYVYIPLGGNQRGKGKQVRNILIVWGLTGIWHGAGWNFLLWGIYFGLLLLLEKFILKPYLERLPVFLQGMYAMILVFLGWNLFAHDDIRQGISYFTQLFGFGMIPFSSMRTWYMLSNYLILFVMTVIGATSWPKRWASSLLEERCGKGAASGIQGTGRSRSELVGIIVETTYTLFLLVLVTAYLVNASYNPFLYFRF